MARLLGAPLLRLHGTVLLAPARFGDEARPVTVDPATPVIGELVAELPPGRHPPGSSGTGAGLAEVNDRLRRTSARQARLG